MMQRGRLARVIFETPNADSCRIGGNIQTGDADFLWYDCDTSDGNSGSAVYRWFNSYGKRMVVGVHARTDYVITYPDWWNAGPRLTTQRINVIVGWRDM